jgi:ribonuclease D
LEYALDDVRYLMPLRDKLLEKLSSLGRLSWFEAEMKTFQDDVETYARKVATSFRHFRFIATIDGHRPRALPLARLGG